MTTDNSRKISDCETEIQQIKNWINHNPLDSNVRFLTAYAVMKACGTIEIVLKSEIYEYLATRTKNETKTYLNNAIVEASFNPSTGKIQSLIEQFSSVMAQQFKNSINGSNEKVDLNALVHLRNDIAHGRTISISITTVERYFLSGKKILEYVDSMLFPPIISA